jgi:adenylate cyclase
LETPVPSTRKLAAILSTDVFGYSSMMGEDDQATVEALNACKAVLRSHVAEHGGRVVDSPGDEMLAEFPSALEAVKAAVEVQREFFERNAMRPENRKMRWRIGVNPGDVMEENGALYGDGVNIAARLQSLGQPGGLCISGTVFDQVDGKLPLKFEAAGEQTVKNIAKLVRVYHWAEGKGVATSQAPAKPPQSSRKAMLVGVGAIALAFVGIAAWQVTHRSTTPSTVSSAAADPVLAMPTGPTVAVLPFANMSGDAGQDYFADGLTEDIITELSRFKDIYVLARNTTFQYKGQAVDVPAIGKKLGAKYVLEGSVRKSADQVRITAN